MPAETIFSGRLAVYKISGHNFNGVIESDKDNRTLTFAGEMDYTQGAPDEYDRLRYDILDDEGKSLTKYIAAGYFNIRPMVGFNADDTNCASGFKFWRKSFDHTQSEANAKGYLTMMVSHGRDCIHATLMFEKE
jgi:hypothetical protein